MKEIKGFTNYLIYPNGTVYSKKRNYFLKPHYTKLGYVQFRLYKDGNQKSMLAHRIVAEAYIDNPLNKATVNHLNGVKDDNNVNNLEWATQSEQIIHARKFGLIKVLPPVPARKAVTNGLKVYESCRSAEADGFNQGAISLVCRGLRKQHGGYKWSFVGGF